MDKKERLMFLHQVYEEQEQSKSAAAWIFNFLPPIDTWVYVWPNGFDHFGLKGKYYGGNEPGSWYIEGLQEAGWQDVRAWRYIK